MLSPSRSPGRFARRSRQRGAVGIGLILLMISMVLFLAMAVDTGRLYMEKRKLQKQADLAALSLGRSACYIDGINNKDALETLVKQNLAANGFDTSASNPTIEFGAAQITGNQWQFEPASTAVKSAGRVTISKTVPGSLISQLYNPNDVTLSASAAVYKRMSVGFGVGSRTIDVDLTNSVLGAALGGSLSVVSYQGLADTKVRLGGLLSALNDMGLLAVDLTAGTLDEVLDTQLTIAQFIEANILAVSDYAVLDADVLPALHQLESMPEVSALYLTLSDIIKLAAGANEEMNDEIRRAALASQIALFDLVSGAIYAANKDNFLLIPNLAVDLGVAGLVVALKVTEPPQFTMGVLPASAEDGFVTSVTTSQVELKLKATLLGGGLDLGVLVLNVGTIGVSAEVAKAETRLLDANGCQFSGGNGMTMAFATKPSVALLKVGDGGPPNDATDFGDVSQPIRIGAYVNILLGTVPVEIDISANVPVSASDFIEHSNTVDPMLELPQLVGSVSPPIGTTLSDTLNNIELDAELNVANLGLLNGVLNIVLGLLTNTVLPLVASLLNSLLLSVLDPLLSQVLGIQVGTADVFVTSIDVDGGGLIQ
ncbi:pilus assembly protein TadG-related protein [Photobacterium halotolerans]|uniref:pilus assembly protein TadG-related protein n=1 Tax=Photobacterium halotolerans TaxID=265726 RepID=UPI00041CBF91|nr:pilus assembly protein TadG-related protein [Photobacterium halotolerans]